MLILKSASDLEKMKKAGEVAVGTLELAKSIIKVGVTTAYIDSQIQGYIESRGCMPSFLGYRDYPNATCISINNEVIHGIPACRVLHEGDIVGVDVGVICEGFHGDNAATFAVGKISHTDQKLLAVTKECLFRAIEIARKPNRVGDIGYTVQTYAEQNGYSVVREYTGHGLGRNLHEQPDVPNFGRRARGLRLVEGMTIAIEPMINAGVKDIYVLEDGWTVVTADDSNSAHFEMSIAITDSNATILTDWREVL